jgi:hypothetical protein
MEWVDDPEVLKGHGHPDINSDYLVTFTQRLERGQERHPDTAADFEVATPYGWAAALDGGWSFRDGDKCEIEIERIGDRHLVRQTLQHSDTSHSWNTYTAHLDAAQLRAVRRQGTTTTENTLREMITHPAAGQPTNSPPSQPAAASYPATEPATRKTGPRPLSPAQFDRIRQGDTQDRAQAASHPASPPGLLEWLSRDTDIKVRRDVAINKASAVAFSALGRLARDQFDDVRSNVAQNEACPPEILGLLALDPTPQVRMYVAANPSCYPATLKRLAQDKHRSVRQTARNALFSRDTAPSEDQAGEPARQPDAPPPENMTEAAVQLSRSVVSLIRSVVHPDKQ